jgi:hypothetical protein
VRVGFVTLDCSINPYSHASLTFPDTFIPSLASLTFSDMFGTFFKESNFDNLASLTVFCNLASLYPLLFIDFLDEAKGLLADDANKPK